MTTTLRSALNAGFFDYVKYINMWEIFLVPTYVFVNQEALAELPADVRETFYEVMRKWQPSIGIGWFEDDKSALVDAVMDWGAIVVAPDKAVRDEIREACKAAIWQPWLDEAGAEGARALEIIDRVVAEAE